MKSILMAACCAVIMFAADNAKAVFCDMASCGSTITLDSGVGKNCNRTGTGCECAYLDSECGISAIRKTTCGGANWNINNGAMIGGGGICCGWSLSPGDECPKAEVVDAINAENARLESERMGQEVTTTSGDQQADYSLSSVMDDSIIHRDLYYGWKDDIVRSPSAGRTTSAKARLDACLFHSDVDWIETNGGSNNSEKHATCVGTDYGCGNTGKNEHCNATGMNDGVSVSAAVCKDRCDCVYSQGTCAGL